VATSGWLGVGFIDQRAVDAAQAAVARDQAAPQRDTDPRNPQVIAGAPEEISLTTCSLNSACTAEYEVQARFRADQVKLKVAQGQLKKDESSGVTGTTIPSSRPPTTQPVNCGALSVGLGAGPPAAAFPGLP